ncbi:MAG: Gfo/Idh/MocA family protein [Bacteroidales bacterium]
MSGTINWGIIAPGKIASKFASDLKLVKNAILHAVASRDMSRAKKFASTYNANKAYGSYVELVNDPKVDIVYIASPHVLHYEQTLMCLNKGKHVLCEKPMGMNAQQVKELAGIAKEKGLFLMEALWTQFLPSFKKCKEIVADGLIGHIKFIQADFGFKANYDTIARTFSKNLGGGSLLDIGIYPVFFALEILGEPEKIRTSAIIGDTGVDETCSMVFSYPSKGVVANLASSFLVKTPTEALICGTNGTIKLHSQWHTPTSLTLTQNDSEQLFTFDEPGFGYEHEIREVLNCLEKGLIESESFPLSKSFQLHQILDKVRKIIGLQYIYD